MCVCSNQLATNKTSIYFLLNSPGSSADFNRSPQAYASTHSPITCHNQLSLDHLLKPTSIPQKQDGALSVPNSATFGTSSTSQSIHVPSRTYPASNPASPVVQKGVTKKRRRQKISCEICDRVFGDSSSARKHHRVVHLRIKEFECNECGKTFAEKSNRSKHFIAAHLKQRNHPCPDCDKVFNFTDGLRRHRNNVHFNIRPYPCHDCDSSYKQKTHLHKHRQSVHGATRPSAASSK